MIIGMFLRHLKIYKGIKYIPLGYKHNFISYLGENGSGKSSVLEALNSFLNHKQYSINKSALKDSVKGENFPYISPIFLIEKSKLTKNKKELERLSNYFWNIEKKDLGINTQKSTSEFFELRDSIDRTKYTEKSHYLILVGENIEDKSVYFHGFQRDKDFVKAILSEDAILEIEFFQDDYFNPKEAKEGKEVKKTDHSNVDKHINNEYKKLLEDIKNTYSYIYVPVEIDVEDFTKIETETMQKVFGKPLKDEILEALDNDFISDINNKLNEFVTRIEKTLDGKYFYDSEKGGTTKKYLKNYDLFEKILEVYFQIRVLNKGTSQDRKLAKKISELSAGEKRQALISLVYAFLSKDEERDKYVVVAIDEPENSLHTSLCYEQFEKLKEISKNNQILLTTHWYGFLPVLSEGLGHFLSKSESKDKVDISFETYDLYDYKAKVKSDIEGSKNKMPKDFYLKSMNDLVQSIFYSLICSPCYNWLVCEGVSEKIYFEFFFSEIVKHHNLRILPMGGIKYVSRLYKHLDLPVNDDKGNGLKGKVFCLIDTDEQRHEDSIGRGNKFLQIRRLSNKDTDPTNLLGLSDNCTRPAELEQSLNPVIFQETIDLLIDKYDIDVKYKIGAIQNPVGNSCFISNFRNYDLKDFFAEEEGKYKEIFAKEYIDLLKQKENAEKYTPLWVKQILDFFAE